jgi:hypothetical protein
VYWSEAAGSKWGDEFDDCDGPSRYPEAVSLKREPQRGKTTDPLLRSDAVAEVLIRFQPFRAGWAGRKRRRMERE